VSTAALSIENAISATASAIRSIDDARKAAWLAERRTCITGTDIAAIFGLNKWTSPIEVWLSKKNQIEKPDNDAMEFGRRFERPILEVYSERLGQPIEFAEHWSLIRVPGFPLLGASLDARWLNGDRRPVDAKNTRFRSEQWGENGSDVFPVYYQLQLAVQMMATETQDADLAVCFAGSEFARYSMHRDAEVDAAIMERADEWWKKHIVGDMPPEPDGSESYGSYLKAKFARSTELVMKPTPIANEWAVKLRAAKERLKAVEAEELEAENWLKAFMGEASTIPGICTWKNNKDGETVDYKAIVSELAPLVDSEKAREIINLYTTPKPGVRVFRLSK
jgi:putative phage-type endonuclease